MRLRDRGQRRQALSRSARGSRGLAPHIPQSAGRFGVRGNIAPRNDPVPRCPPKLQNSFSVEDSLEAVLLDSFVRLRCTTTRSWRGRGNRIRLGPEDRGALCGRIPTRGKDDPRRRSSSLKASLLGQRGHVHPVNLQAVDAIGGGSIEPGRVEVLRKIGVSIERPALAPDPLKVWAENFGWPSGNSVRLQALAKQIASSSGRGRDNVAESGLLSGCSFAATLKFRLDRRPPRAAATPWAVWSEAAAGALSLFASFWSATSR